eukprot:TRINITY_DN1953_c0_g1_i2.p1 TRINITY_DN1953_c0_g1~~TRINITY_DN1953_c0_g1_i2.p1  ORF type:complete len:279 (+),score=82.29 TRINITY_DN1953_c0_g1_i2:545-1381(+)
MKSILMVLFLTIFLTSVNSLNLFGENNKLAPNDWDRLVVTFGKFKGLPTSQAAADAAGWTPFGTCADGHPFNRYILGDDLGSLILFDNLGFIAGYSIGTVNVSPFRPDVWKRENFNGRTFSTLTFFFQDPNTVCKRTSAVTNLYKFAKLGDITGDRVWLQTENDYLAIPLTQSSADQTPGFVKGGCFFTMGVHYWYNISSAQPCAEFFPLFALYNRGQLNGFGTGEWNFNDPSPRFEHPAGNVIKLFFDQNTLPQCLLGQEPLSTQHIYLSSPLLDLC